MLIRFYKPFGVLCQFSGDGSGKPTLKDYIPLPDVYPAGRLDHDSEGLLLLTGDGALQQRLSHPRFAHTKTYWVQVERIPSEAALEQLRNGIVIQGERTLPATVKLMAEPQLPPRHPPIRYRKNVPTSWLELILREGRNRQVRRMTAAIGHPTLRLIRAAIGDITLQGLAPGQYEILKESAGPKAKGPKPGNRRP